MTDHQAEIAQLQATVKKLTTELDDLKKIVANPTPISADAYPHLLTQSAPVNQVLDISLSKAIDLYRDCPQILEPVARRVALDKEHFSLDGSTRSLSLTFHVNSNGSFWVIQLQSQGHYLFPRPTDSKRINRLSLLDQIFTREGKNKDAEPVDFEILEPAQLEVLKLNENWRLKRKGVIHYSQTLFKSQSYSELETIRKQYELLCRKVIGIEEKYEQVNTAVFREVKKVSQVVIRLESVEQLQKEILPAVTNTSNEIALNKALISDIINLLEQDQKLTQTKNKIISKLIEKKQDIERKNLNTSACHNLDPFYNDVITRFNALDDYWFWSQIDARKFRKVQITKYSVLGEVDIEGKVITKLELDEQNGILLVYEAANKCWLIPNPLEPKWRIVLKGSRSLFTGSSGTSLISPAEVEALGNNVWQLKKKGQFE